MHIKAVSGELESLSRGTGLVSWFVRLSLCTPQTLDFSPSKNALYKVHPPYGLKDTGHYMSQPGITSMSLFRKELFQAVSLCPP